MAMKAIQSIPDDPLEELRIRHTRLSNLMSDLACLLGSKGDILAILGPTGVGKSVLNEYLVKTALKDAAEEMQANPALLPAILIEAESSGEEKFSWRSFYQDILEQLGEDITMPRQNYDIDPVTGRLVRARYTNTNTLSGLRKAVVKALKARKVQFLVIEEAAHIFSQCSARKLLIQLNTLKSLSNTSGAQLVLAGSYDLYELVSLSGQLARRIQVIHFSRYREDVDADVRAYRACLQQCQAVHKGLWGNSLMEHADVLMENTIGCIGTLTSVLKHAVKFAASRGGWSLDVLEAALLTEDQREKILLEVLEGERRIEPGITRDLRLHKKTTHKVTSKIHQEAA